MAAPQPKEAYLSFSEWENYEAFIKEKALKLFSKGTLYIPGNKRLPYPMQYDPKTKAIYINLDSQKKGFIGAGGNKVVTKSIKYDKDPILVARCSGGQTVISEGNILKKLRGNRGIVQFHSLIKYSNDKADLFIDYCELGNLKTIELKKLELTNKDFINLILDLFIGLKTIHDKGFVHRDLHRSNILLKDVDGYICAFIADFGLSFGIHEHPEYRIGVPNVTCPPEVLLKEYRDIDRKKAECYSIASIAYQLINGENPPWSDIIHQERLPETSTPQRIKTFQYIEKLYQRLLKGRSQEPLKLTEKMIDICLKMLHPYPEKRIYLDTAIKELKKL